MSTQLTALGVLAVMSLVWLLVNLKTNRSATGKTFSYIALWACLIAMTFVGARLVWGMLS